MYFVRTLCYDDFEQGYKKCLEELYEDVVWRAWSDNTAILVAVSSITRRIIGTAAGIFIWKMGHGGRCVCLIEDVAVDPDYRGLGIGPDLVARLVAHAKHVNAYKVILNCDEDVFEWYQKQGFEQHGYAMRLSLE